jgi:hypothetical protein
VAEFFILGAVILVIVGAMLAAAIWVALMAPSRAVSLVAVLVMVAAGAWGIEATANAFGL